ncbi:MAG: hypothetical protein NTY07_00170 [Bacteroidia bacterium]|nr:hypothetical protein [Bacteroidia bacterium]
MMHALCTKRSYVNFTCNCEVWIKIDGAAPVEPSELTYVGTVTRSPLTTTSDLDMH